MTDLPDMGPGLYNLAALAAIATDMQATSRAYAERALVLAHGGFDARAEAVAVVAMCATGSAALARTLAETYDPTTPDTTDDVAGSALLHLACCAVLRAQAHLHHLADEETPDGHV